MKRITLRTQVIVLAVLLGMLLSGAGIALWMRAESEAIFRSAFETDIAILTELPLIRSAIRRLDLELDKFMLTGKPEALAARQAIIEELGALHHDLEERARSLEERSAVAQLRESLDLKLTRHDARIAARVTGHASTHERRDIGNHPTTEQIIDTLEDLQKFNVNELHLNRARSRQASQRMLVLLLALGILASLAVAVLLDRFVIRPIARLVRTTDDWQFGRPWPATPVTVSAEVAQLYEHSGRFVKNLEQQFQKERELSEFKSRLVSLVSHEYGNALTSVQTVAYLLRESRGSEEDRDRLYKMLTANVQALTLATSNLLNMGRLETGLFAIEPRPVELTRLIRDTVERMELLSERAEVRVHVQAPNDTVELRADPDALSLVLSNLIGNAIKYTPKGGSVTAGVELPPGDPAHARVFVDDTGIGVSEEERRRIAEPYFRTESGKNAAKGFGIGLSLVKQILDAHGARLDIASEPGKGSRFSFLLPRSGRG